MRTLLLLIALFLFADNAKSLAQEININILRAKDTYEVGSTRVSRRNVKERISVDEEALRRFKTGEALGATGIATCATGAHLLAAGVILAIDNSIKNEELYGSEKKDNSLAWTFVGSGIGALVPGALMMFIGKEQRIKAVRKYNRSISGLEDQSSIYIRPASQGIGLTLVF